MVVIMILLLQSKWQFGLGTSVWLEGSYNAFGKLHWG